MDLDRAIGHLKTTNQGVLATIKRDGRPQLSNIIYVLDGDAPEPVIRISVTGGRAKTKNLRRDPRASLYAVGSDFWHYVVIEAEAELTPVATDPSDDTVDELVALYQAIQGEHPDWDEYRRAMVADRRLVVRLRPARAYGMWQ